MHGQTNLKFKVLGSPWLWCSAVSSYYY